MSQAYSSVHCQHWNANPSYPQVEAFAGTVCLLMSHDIVLICAILFSFFVFSPCSLGQMHKDSGDKVYFLVFSEEVTILSGFAQTAGVFILRYNLFSDVTLHMYM